MKNARTAVTLCSGLALASIALAQEPSPGPTKLPLNPFESAREGDWAVLVARRKHPVRGETRGVVGVHVTRVTADEVAIVISQNGRASPERVFKRKDATLEAVVGAPRGAEPRDVKIEDEKKTVGERSFDCKKVTYNLRIAGPGRVTAVQEIAETIWFASGVKGFGMVARSQAIKEVLPGGRDHVDSTSSSELAGFGNGDKVEWGKRADEIDPNGR